MLSTPVSLPVRGSSSRLLPREAVPRFLCTIQKRRKASRRFPCTWTPLSEGGCNTACLISTSHEGEEHQERQDPEHPRPSIPSSSFRDGRQARLMEGLKELVEGGFASKRVSDDNEKSLVQSIKEFIGNILAVKLHMVCPAVGERLHEEP